MFFINQRYPTTSFSVARGTLGSLNFFLVESVNERKYLFITHLVAKNLFLIIFDSSSGAFSTYQTILKKIGPQLQRSWTLLL